MAGLSKDAGLERVVLSGGPLRIDEVVGVARGRAAVELSDAGRKRMTASREVVERLVTEGKRAYGVSTGFGLLANTPIAPADLRELQRRIVLSHATGSGDPLEPEVVRAMQLLRARTLVQGYSGVRPVVVEALLALLDAGITPVIPEHGSVGASGDLAQLAHLALPLIGEGEVQVDGQRLPAIEGLRRAGLEPLELSYKEGLSLVNGTEGMLALACLAVADAEALATAADVACAMSIEGLLGTDRPFQRRLHELRPHPGQLASADNLRELLAAAGRRRARPGPRRPGPPGPQGRLRAAARRAGRRDGRLALRRPARGPHPPGRSGRCRGPAGARRPPGRRVRRRAHPRRGPRRAWRPHRPGRPAGRAAGGHLRARRAGHDRRQPAPAGRPPRRHGG